MSQADNLIDLGAVVAQAVEDKTAELQKELAEAKAENQRLDDIIKRSLGYLFVHNASKAFSLRDEHLKKEQQDER